MAKSLELISSQSLGGTTSSVTFSSIPSTYTDLMILLSTKTTSVSYYGWVNYYFNGSNANTNTLYMENASSGSGGNLYAGSLVGNSGSGVANIFGNASIYIPNYTNSSYYKSSSVDAVGENNGTSADRNLIVNLSSNTAAVSSITFQGAAGATNFLAYSTFYLYGIHNS